MDEIRQLMLTRHSKELPDNIKASITNYVVNVKGRQDLLELCLLLSTYDYCGYALVSDWDPKHKRYKTMFDHTLEVLKAMNGDDEEEAEYVKEEVEKMSDDYYAGRVPDGFGLTIRFL